MSTRKLDKKMKKVIKNEIKLRNNFGESQIIFPHPKDPHMDFHDFDFVVEAQNGKLPSSQFNLVDIEVKEDPETNVTNIFSFGNCTLSFALGEVRRYYDDKNIVSINCRPFKRVRVKEGK